MIGEQRENGPKQTEANITHEELAKTANSELRQDREWRDTVLYACMSANEQDVDCIPSGNREDSYHE
jgi:hypothetical protein